MAKLKLTKQEIQEAIPKTHGVKKYLAEKLSVDRQTIYRYFDRYPDLEEASQEYLDSITDEAEHHLIEAVRAGNPWAVRYWLSTRGKNRGYSTKQEATFNGMYPMQTITSGVADPPMQNISIKIPDNANDNDRGTSYEKNYKG